jgi:hypothetical protein
LLSLLSVVVCSTRYVATSVDANPQLTQCEKSGVPEVRVELPAPDAVHRVRPRSPLADRFRRDAFVSVCREEPAGCFLVARSEYGVRRIDAFDPKAPLLSSVCYLSGEVVAQHAVDGLAMVVSVGPPKPGASHGTGDL